MIRSILLAMLALATLPAASCNPLPGPTPPPPAGAGGDQGAGGAPGTGGSSGTGGNAPASPYAAACAAMAAVGCPSGLGQACASRLQLAVEKKTTLSPINLSCLTAATTRPAADACGFGCE